MVAVGRYVKMTAREGRADELADALLEVAKGLADVAGCELYIVNRSPSEPDVVWVTELWASQETIDAALASEDAKARIPLVQELVAGIERIEVTPLGGVGHLAGGTGFTLVNLEDVEDQAPKFGLGELGEARFARRDLAAVATGISHQRLAAGRRQAFGHRHRHAEEIYVVLRGTGRVRIDGEIRELRARDAIRIAPESPRAFEAGPEGLELIAIGAHHSGDVEMLSDFWPPGD